MKAYKADGMMLRVYILLRHLFDGSEIIGVYTCRQSAEDQQRIEESQGDEYRYTVMPWIVED